MGTRRASFDDKLESVRRLAAAPPSAAASELRRLLADPNGYLVGETARVAARLELRELVPDIAAACRRLLASPETDKGCNGKKQIVEALMALDAPTVDVYLGGLRHVQKEPAFGGPVDTASALRGLCAYALVRMRHPGAALEVAPLLVDPEPQARAAAAGALAATGEGLCAAILHLKALTGDDEPDVIGACYQGMLALAPGRYLDVVGAALLRGEQSAAVALGESRRPEALPLLQRALEGASGPLQDSVLLGIALLRMDEANAFLVRLVEDAPEARAAAAVNALGLHRYDEKITQQTRQAAQRRGSRRILRAFSDRFESP